MARGHPDDFGFPMYPSYGPFTVLQGDTVCPAGAWTDVVSIAAKGRIYTGIFRIPDTALGAFVELKLTVDGVDMAWTSLGKMLDYAEIKDANAILTLLYYDNVGLRYSWQLKEGITFGSALKLSMKPAFIVEATVQYDVSYSKVL